MKKIICLVMMLLITIPVFLSCGDDGEDEKSKTANESAGVSTDESEPDPDVYGSDLEVKDLKGRVIRVLCRDWAAGSTSIMGYNGEVIQREDFDETKADFVDSAKYQVRKTVEQKYNCTIEGDLSSLTPAEFNRLVETSMLGSLDEAYDMVFDGWGHSSPLVAGGVYVDLNTIETINFSNPWWDQNAKDDMSIMGKLFWALGDINTYDNDGTWVMLYNKEMAKKLLPDKNFYEMVKDDEWTLDNFIELCRGVTTDNGDGVLDEEDIWGFGTETYNAFIQVIGVGGRITKKNDQDEPEFAYRDTQTMNALDKIISFYNEENTVMVANAGRFDSKGYTNVWESTIIRAFKEGRELFFCCGLINIVGFRDLDFAFGILPIPKLNNDQDSYYHTVSMHNMSALSLPNISKDYYDLGLVIEALGAESKNILTPVYYDKTLKSRDANEEEDEEMLDLIFSTRSFDLGTAFNWGNTLGVFMALNPNVSSEFDKIESAAEAALKETLDALRK